MSPSLNNSSARNLPLAQIRNLSCEPYVRNNDIYTKGSVFEDYNYNKLNDCSDEPFDLSFRPKPIFNPFEVAQDAQTTPLNLSLSSRLVPSTDEENFLSKPENETEELEEQEQETAPIDYSICRASAENFDSSQNEKRGCVTKAVDSLPIDCRIMRLDRGQDHWSNEVSENNNKISPEPKPCFTVSSDSDTSEKLLQIDEEACHSKSANEEKNTNTKKDKHESDKETLLVPSPKEHTLLYAHHLLLQRYRQQLFKRRKEREWGLRERWRQNPASFKLPPNCCCHTQKPTPDNGFLKINNYTFRGNDNHFTREKSFVLDRKQLKQKWKTWGIDHSQNQSRSSPRHNERRALHKKNKPESISEDEDARLYIHSDDEQLTPAQNISPRPTSNPEEDHSYCKRNKSSDIPRGSTKNHPYTKNSEGSRDQRKQLKRCSLCLNHGAAVKLRGHAGNCPHRSCRCDRCAITKARQLHMLRQQRLTRKMQKEKS